MKKRFKLALIGLALISGLGLGKVFANFAAHSDFTDFWTIKGIGTLNNTAITWIDSTYRSFHLYDGDLILGGKGNQPSTTAGEYPGLKVQLKNCGGSSWTAQQLISVSTSSDGCGQTAAATADLTNWIGIAEATVAVGSVGYITVGGYALALTTGSVNRGDTLVSTSATAGYLWADTSPTTGADVGVSLSSRTTPGTVIIRLR